MWGERIIREEKISVGIEKKSKELREHKKQKKEERESGRAKREIRAGQRLANRKRPEIGSRESGKRTHVRNKKVANFR